MSVSRRTRRAAFFAYAGALFVATHWPGLKIESEFYRPDILLHLVVFAIWTALVIACAFFKARPLSAVNVFASCTLAIAYAALDEGLQAIPALRRTASWDDFAADICGIVLATLAALLVGRLRSRPPQMRDRASE